MAITDKTGINVASGFKLVAPVPIDARFVATDETDLQSLITNNAVYKGLTVWVDSLSKSMVYNGTEFVPIASGDIPENVVEIVEMPLDLMIKLVSVDEGTYVDLTDEEMSLFENAKNKVYYCGFSEVAQVNIEYRYVMEMIGEDATALILESAVNGIWINTIAKNAKVVKTLVDTELKEVEAKADYNTTDITKLQKTIGNIDEVLDEINGGGTTSGGATSGGGSSSGGMTLKSISETFDFSDTNEWEVSEDGLTSTVIGEATITKIQNLFNSLTLNPNIISGKLTLIGTINQIIGGLNFSYTAIGNAEQMSILYCSLCGLIVPNVPIQITIFYDTEGKVYGINTTETSPLSGEIKFDFYYYE